jgi:hypothetical protein
MKKLSIFILSLFLAISSFSQGIVLKATTETLELLTSSTADIDYSIVWYDITSSGAGLSNTNEGKITSATTTVVVAAPGASTSRHVKEIIIKDIHASTANTVRFKKDISTTEYQLTGDVVLQAGESLLYTDAQGWVKYSSGGIFMAASVSFQVDVQTFSGNGTWTKPTGFTTKYVSVQAWGAGGGGGAGASLASATIAKGGGGSNGAFTVCAAGLTTTQIRLCLADQITPLTTSGIAGGTTTVSYGRVAIGVPVKGRFVTRVTGSPTQVTVGITATDATTPITNWEMILTGCLLI